MATKFLAPANLDDFDRATTPALKAKLADDWHTLMKGQVDFGVQRAKAFWSAIDPPAGSPAPAQAAPQWTGLPRTIKRLVGPSIADAARLVDEPHEIGTFDPVDQTTYSRFRDTAGLPFPGQMYRSQDEYLEWVAHRDASGTITEIVFTCEGPEYWDNIAQDRKLLEQLYNEICGQNVPADDLFFPKEVHWQNPYGGPTRYRKGDYNPFNKWNAAHAVHLTQPANTLSAEINLAWQATLAYGNPTPVTSDPDLVCCAGYGGVNRMSDPTIGSGVNTQVIQLGHKVALRNPIGLYIKGLAPNSFSFADGTPFLQQDASWTVLRPKTVTDMILRARFRVPDGVTHNGQQVRVGDLLVNSEKIDTGGQVADVITMTLYALAIPGAPQQTGVGCNGRPCPDKAHPDFIQVIPFGSTCPPDGISPQLTSMLAAKASGPTLSLEMASAPATPQEAAAKVYRSGLWR
jgi:hypothetical protein